jgi:hypothetical protein
MLTDHQLPATGHRYSPASHSSTPQAPEPIAQTELWQFFFRQRDQILRDKWIDSRNATHDIGMERATRDRLQTHHALWSAPQDVAQTPPPYLRHRQPESATMEVRWNV